jgi:PilZ domain.
VDGETERSGKGPQRPRRNARVALQAEVQLRRSGQRHYRVDVHDVSPDGCRLEFIERPRLDEMVWVKFDTIDSLEANVCWVSGHDVGVEFVRPIHPAVFEDLVRRLKQS